MDTRLHHPTWLRLPQHACAWPARLESWLRELYGNPKVRVLNFAAPATGLSYARDIIAMKHTWMRQQVDLFLVDYSINSIRYAQEKDAAVDE